MNGVVKEITQAHKVGKNRGKRFYGIGTDGKVICYVTLLGEVSQAKTMLALPDGRVKISIFPRGSDSCDTSKMVTLTMGNCPVEDMKSIEDFRKDKYFLFEEVTGKIRLYFIIYLGLKKSSSKKKRGQPSKPGTFAWTKISRS